jgi:hypothetical protein
VLGSTPYWSDFKAFKPVNQRALEVTNLGTMLDTRRAYAFCVTAIQSSGADRKKMCRLGFSEKFIRIL